MRLIASFVFVLSITGPLFAAGRPMKFDDLLAVKSVADPQVSPDGKLVVYVLSEIDRPTGKTNSDLWLVPVAGGEPRRLTTSPGADNHPRWRPDGRSIAFVSDRSGSSQVWLLPVDGGEARQLTRLPIDVSGPNWSPKGDSIAFAAEVYPSKTPDETAAMDKRKAESRSKVRIYDRLMIRHWSSWDEGKRSHLFVADAKSGEARDLTPKLEVNTPPGPFGGSTDYSFSADGKELAFTAEPSRDAAWSTNSDIWVVPVAGGEAKNLTEDNKGADAQPAFSPDGRFLAYVSQRRAGFESDLWVLRVRDLKSGRVDDVSSARDRPVTSLTWDRSQPSMRTEEDHGSRLVVSIDDQGSEILSRYSIDLSEGKWKSDSKDLTSSGRSGSPQLFNDGQTLVFVRSSTERPAELYRKSFDDKSPVALTSHNDELVAKLDLPKARSFKFEGADGDTVSGWLISPPGFDPSKKYAVVFLIHGGPQGAWHDEWHGRWNYQMFASPGYAVVAINPRGSTGYGQKFTDQISTDWTGRVYEDLMKGLDHALKSFPYLDGDRVAAAGGSYGGFMVNWIAGHTDRFKALISHAGVFDLTSKYGTTEELWFPEWEFGGTPWDKPEIYREQSPGSFAKKFKTPTLVIHGALDFRVPEAQGLGMFTALQRRGVPSRYVYFPDEGHWISKPANREVWWRESLGWLEKYLEPSKK